MSPRTPASAKAAQVAHHFRGEHPDYNYLKDVFRALWAELHVTIPREPRKLPYVPPTRKSRPSAKLSGKAGIEHSISPNKLRH